MSLTLARQTDQANIRGSEGAGTTTLTAADSKWQIFNLSAARTVVLPSADIKAGDVIRLENRGVFDLTIQSSDLTTLSRTNTATNSAGDPTCQSGYSILVAIQDNPTASSHWKVAEVYELYAHTTSINNSSASPISIDYGIVRSNRLVTVTAKTAAVSITKANTSNPQWASAMPTRFRPTAINGSRYGTQDRNNGVDESGTFEVQANGLITWYRPGEAAWTAAAGFILYNTSASYSQPD